MLPRLRFAVGVLGLVAMGMLAGLLIAAVGISVGAGWDRVVLTSGSMSPAVRTGDVVLTDPTVEHMVAPGTVLTFVDPNGPGRITHRVVEATAEGYRTQGDANADPDSTLVRPHDVLGQGRVRIPWLGLPSVWVQQGQSGLAAAGVAAVLACLWLSRFGMLDRYDPWLIRAHPPAGRGPTRRTSVLRTSASVLVPLVLVGAGLSWASEAHSSDAAFTAVSGSLPGFLSAGPVPRSWYLKASGPGDTVASATLPMSTAAPTSATLRNYDTNRDQRPGLLLAKDKAGIASQDPTKVQKWNLPVTGGMMPMTLRGTVQVRLWSAMKEFITTKNGQVQAGLFDCAADGNNCTQIASNSQTITAGEYAGSGSWVAKTISLGTLAHPMAMGRVLQVRVAVAAAAGDDMWFAFDTTAHPSALTVAYN